MIGETLSKILVSNYVVAVLLILIGYVIANFARKIIFIIMEGISVDSFFKKFDINFSVTSYTSYLAEFVIYLIFIVRAMEEISPNLPLIVFDILGVLVIVVVLLSLLLTIKDFFPNLYASYNLYQIKKLNAGDKIKFGDIEGKIKSIGLLETILISKNNDLVYVPNKYLVNSSVTKK